MTETARSEPRSPDRDTPGRRAGPALAVLVVAVCLVVGQLLARVVLRLSGVDGDSLAGLGLFNVVAFGPTAALLAAWVVLREGRPFAALGLRGADRYRRIAVGVGTALVGLLALNVALSAFSSDTGTSGEAAGPSVAPWQMALLLLTFAVQAPTEELLFRGYLLPALRERWGVAAGVLLSSALFAAAHTANPGATAGYVLLTFLLGVSLALWTLADGNLWRACAFHTVWNWAPAVLSPGDGDDGGQGTTALEGGTLTAAVLVLVLLALSALWAYRRSVQRVSAS
ncbi:CPBP family intramembrane glutamic endopeptidase [Streptomyces bohaiensis]|uniref:CPBP family intramembrane metalloprotease n=1 Tax=Streptomyces bohaiensis TaxID=1431344 RepID=A0ABX1CEX3_9ACTN|nr:type II CAAX endopeptidase family protein [Streptomyces bohaiensis]NJQ14899.1 CPBP family intramembrane metalloprotease [Streptomyces bohaiensis]